MIIRKIKQLGILIALSGSFIMPCSATDFGFQLSKNNDLVSQSLYDDVSFFSFAKFSTKLGKTYDEANDPAIKSSTGGPEDTSPQHGYFSVPLIVIGLAGVLLYFSKID